MKRQERKWYKELWFYRTFICGHWFSGQITREIIKSKHVRSARHYRECQKCGKKKYTD